MATTYIDPKTIREYESSPEYHRLHPTASRMVPLSRVLALKAAIAHP